MLSWICLLNASAASSKMKFDGVVAEVGGEKIFLTDVASTAGELAYSAGSIEQYLRSEDVAQSFQKQALQDLINRRLVLLEYEKSEVKIPEWYLNDRIQRIIDSSFDGDRGKLNEFLLSRGITFEEWRADRIEDMIFMTMRQQFVDQNVHVRPIDIEKYYKENYADAKLGGHVAVSMIMVPLSTNGVYSLEWAKDTVSSLRNGGDFAAVARAHSIDSHAAKGGSWGYIEPADEFRSELAKAIEPMGIGAISDSIVLDGYIYILRKDDERASLEVPLLLVRDEIEKLLFSAMCEARFDEWINLLRSKYTVRVY